MFLDLLQQIFHESIVLLLQGYKVGVTRTNVCKEVLLFIELLGDEVDAVENAGERVTGDLELSLIDLLDHWVRSLQSLVLPFHLLDQFLNSH